MRCTSSGCSSTLHTISIVQVEHYRDSIDIGHGTYNIGVPEAARATVCATDSLLAHAIQIGFYFVAGEKSVSAANPPPLAHDNL